MVSLFFKAALALFAFFLLTGLPTAGGVVLGWAMVAGGLWGAWWMFRALFGDLCAHFLCLPHTSKTSASITRSSASNSERSLRGVPCMCITAATAL